jgi:hypothetical protein
MLDRTSGRRLRAGGAHVHPFAAELPQEGRGDLRASGVLHAHEQHSGGPACAAASCRARASSRSAANAAVRDGTYRVIPDRSTSRSWLSRT